MFATSTPTLRAVLRSAFAAALSVTLLTAASCEDDPTSTGTAGEYELLSITPQGAPIGVALPIAYTYDAVDYVLQSGTVLLDEDGGYSMMVSGSADAAAHTFRGDEGTWSREGSVITFDSDNGAVSNYTGTFGSGGTLHVTLTVDGYSGTFNFAK